MMYGLRSSARDEETRPALNTSRGFIPGNKKHRLQAERTRRGGVVPIPARKRTRRGGVIPIRHDVFGTQPIEVAKSHSHLLASM